MSAKKKSRILVFVLLLAAIAFLAYAITHPETSFRWENKITYFIYVLYYVVMAFFFVSPFKDKQ